LEIEISVTSVALSAALMAKMKGENQFWAQPFGLPHLGIMLPVAAGFGLSVFPVLKPTYFELEMHIYGCASPLSMYGTDPTNTTDAADNAATQPAAAAVAGLGSVVVDPADSGVVCSPDDLYGEAPTVGRCKLNNA